MSWLDRSRTGLGVRVAAVLLAAAALGGCFQPLYGDRSIVGGRGIESALAAVDLVPIDAPNGTPAARLAVQVQNEVKFNLRGGSGMISPTHRLNINLVPSKYSLLVDNKTGRVEVENFGIDAVYTLTDLATGRVVLRADAVSRVSYDIPGQQQRFARDRALRDAENRAAKVIAEQVRDRLASYFVGGT